MSNNKLTPEALQRAQESARLAAERYSQIAKSLSALQTPEFLKTVEDVQKSFERLRHPARQLQERLELINAKVNAPLERTRAALEKATVPHKQLVEQITLSLAQFSANTALVESFSQTFHDLQQTHAALAGKKSPYQALLKALGANKDRVGVEPLKIANESKKFVEEVFRQRRQDIERATEAEKLATERVDLSLPAAEAPQGSVHPVSQVMDELAEIFADLGFSVAEGPEIEDQWFNFTALNMPEFHPARAMQDTFYCRRIGEDPEAQAHVLRTHTSPVQIRTMTSQPPPIRTIAPGRVYRSDSDATHTPMFHQVEGLVLDRDITMGHLKWTLETFLKAFFERDDIVLRMRPSYFPFTEPSAEVDVGWSMEKGRRVVGGCEGWMEVLGSGMVHPKVIANCGLDPEEWQGFAFGCGIDRLAMLKYGMDDLRAFFDGDLRWLRHYGFRALDVPTLSGGVGA